MMYVAASKLFFSIVVLEYFLVLRTLMLSPERQSARMSKITNYGLTRSGTGCFIAVPIWQQ